MANAGSTGANNGDEDNDCIIKISDNEDLRLKRLAVSLRNASNKEYTLCDKYRAIVDDIKSRFRIFYNL
jgi:hypothetical protein